MNREEYLRELYGRLRQRMPARELESVMKYYEEYFSEAGVEREAEIIEELGMPEDLARQILSGRGAAEPVDQSYQYRQQMPRRQWTAGKIVLLVCLFPVWFTLLIALPATAVALVVALGAGGIGCIAGGIATLVVGLSAIFTPGVTTTVFFGGLALVCVAVGLMLVVAALALGRVLFRAIGALCQWLFVGGRRGVTV